MLIDGFPFFNELDVLELRLRELDAVADRHIIVQAEETHSGRPKPIYFDPDSARWSPWRGKLETVVLPKMDVPEETGPPVYSRADTRQERPLATTTWIRERAPWDWLDQRLAKEDPKTLVVLSDADEIPSAARLREMAPQIRVDRWTSFRADNFYYYLNLASGRPFHCILFAVAETVTQLGSMYMRDHRKHAPIRPVPGGWHFSYLGGVEAIRTKFQSFAHAEYNTPFMTDPAWIAKMIAERRNLFWSTQRKLIQVPLSRLPHDVQDHPERYAHLLAPEETP